MARERAQGFGHERASRRTPHSERKPIYESDVEANIDKVAHDLKGKRDIGPPAPDDRAHEGIIGKHERRRPNPDIEIKPAGICNFGTGSKRAKTNPRDRRLH